MMSIKRDYFKLLGAAVILCSITAGLLSCSGAGSEAYMRKQIREAKEKAAAEELAKNMPKIISFTIDRNEIFQGDNVTLTWNTSQADNVTINLGIGVVPAAGQMSVSPAASATNDAVYILTVTNKYGTVTAKARTVVMKEDKAPSILFEITPARVKEGLKAKMVWSVYGARSINVDNGIGTLTESSGEKLITPRTAKYTLTATNKAGSSTKSVDIEVIPAGSSQ